MPRSTYKHKSRAAAATQQPRHRGAGELRIIGGQLRGRKLSIADVPGLRPTTDRIRETVFNWLQFELADQRCIDLFAGSGALAFEALSRGAREVIVIEQDTQAAQILSQHAQTLSSVCAGQALVQRADALVFLQQQPAEPFDVIFIDPPFGMDFVNRCVDLLVQYHWIKPGSWIYVETERGLAVNTPTNWQLHREKQAGRVTFRLYLVAE